MLFVTSDISRSLLPKLGKISNLFYNVASKYVSMQMDIGINVYTFASSFEYLAWILKYKSSFG